MDGLNDSAAELEPERRGKGLVLVVHKHPLLRRGIRRFLENAGYHVQDAGDSETAYRMLGTDTFDLVLTNLIDLQPFNGFELIRRIQQTCPSTLVIATSAAHQIETHLDATGQGAHDFIIVPFTEDELLLRLEKAMACRRREQQMLAMAQACSAVYRIDGIVARSAAMQDVVARAMRAARENAHVLIMGEAGTGKRFLARAIHASSRRWNKPLLELNSTSLTPEQMDCALFGDGHARLANEPADRGLFSRVGDGSVLLAEVTGAPDALISKVRQVMAQGCHSRRGDERLWATDARIFMTAKHRIQSELAQCEAVTVLHLPPLRERREDVEMWVDCFLNRLREHFGTALRLGPGVLAELVRRDYPGNLDELRVSIEYGARFSRNGVIDSNAIRIGVT